MKLLFPVLLAVSACAAQAPSKPVFACNLKAFQPQERQRHEKLTRQLYASIQSRRELADGYAFSVEPARMSIVEVADWIALEHKCCPFFDFQVDLQGAGNTLSLSLKGPEGIKPFIQAEIP